MGKALQTHIFVHGDGDPPQRGCLKGTNHHGRETVIYQNHPPPPVKETPFIARQLQNTLSPTFHFHAALTYLHQSILENILSAPKKKGQEKIALQKQRTFYLEKPFPETLISLTAFYIASGRAYKWLFPDKINKQEKIDELATFALHSSFVSFQNFYRY